MVLFERRHAHLLTRRNPELLTKPRAEGLSPAVLDLIFDKYTSLLDANNLADKPHRIFNLDETGLNTDPRLSKVFASKGAKNTYAMSATGGKTTYTVLVCVSATGKYLPPFSVYRAKNCYHTWMTGGPTGASFECTDSGWMTGVI